MEDCERFYVAGPDDTGKIVVKDEDGKFQISTYYQEHYFMKPLCWLEGKPVYKGDVLYYKENGHSIKVKGYNPRMPDNTGLEGTILTQVGYSGRVGSLTWAQISAWTWIKPKTKKEGWVNIYPKSVLNGVSEVACASNVFESESSALKESLEDRLDTIHIEWEE